MTNAPPPLVFQNGSVLLPSGALVRASVAVQDGRIAKVTADPEQVRALARAAESVIDLDGRSLLPGFYDAHVHPVLGCVELALCDLRGAGSLAQYAERIRSYAGANPDLMWIQGGGWDHTLLADQDPRAFLDELLPDRPALLASIDHHAFWVNSAALALAGVDRDTPDPHGGQVERDATGRPNGILHETAVDLVRAFAPPATEDDFSAALRTAQATLHSYGIVGWQDAMVHPTPAGALTHTAYQRADREGWLTAHVTGALLWDAERPGEMDAQIEELRQLRDASHRNARRYRIDAVKIMCDGVAETHTASMLAPYHEPNGHPGHDHGLALVERGELARLTEGLSRAGFQVHFHALGDRAVRDALDAVEHAVAATGRTDLRHQLAHLQFVDAADIARFGRLPATANLQALWAAHDPDDLSADPRIGRQRTERQYPFGDLLGAGARLAMGSDWPVSTPNPLPAIQVAARRIAPGADTQPLDATQALPLPALLTAYTAGSAHACHADRFSGSIVEGKDADLVILDRDLLGLPVEEISNARVDATYIAGDRVFGAGR